MGCFAWGETERRPEGWVVSFRCDYHPPCSLDLRTADCGFRPDSGDSHWLRGRRTLARVWLQEIWIDRARSGSEADWAVVNEVLPLRADGRAFRMKIPG